MTDNPFIRVRSPKLRIMPGEDDELVNEGMYGKAFALYLQTTLAEHGYQTPNVVCEDWGWWVAIAGLQFSCGIGIYGMRIADSDQLDLCATVLAPKGKQWSWGKFRFVDNTLEIEKLHQALREICDSDNEITVVSETPDFPLGLSED
jgi:hypothetical protein